MLENPPMWLNYNNSAKMSGPKFLHSAVTDSLQVIANAWLQLLLLRVAQPVIRFRGPTLFHTTVYSSPQSRFFTHMFPFISLFVFVWQAQVQIARDNAVTSQQRSASGRRIRKEACSGTEVDRTGSNPFSEKDSGILNVEVEEEDEVRGEKIYLRSHNKTIKHFNWF